MDMNYGCDVSNRYTAYLDSSDHGNSMSSSLGKNKRKTKKKRKSKNPQLNANKDQNPIQDAEPKSSGVAAEQHQSFSTNSKIDRIDDNESLHHETVTVSTDGPTSLPSCDSPIQSNTSNEEFKEAMNIIETKWSVICFEEEKQLMSHDVDDVNLLNEPELVFKDQRIYPTVYFYNSKFGNKNRRVVYNDRGRHSRWNHETNSQTNDGKDKKQRNRNGRRRQQYSKSNDTNNHEPGDTREIHSADEKHTESHTESNDRASQHTGESNTREYTKNRYNKFKHGTPQRTFTRSRRIDFVRNV